MAPEVSVLFSDRSGRSVRGEVRCTMVVAFALRCWKSPSPREHHRIWPLVTVKQAGRVLFVAYALPKRRARLEREAYQRAADVQILFDCTKLK